MRAAAYSGQEVAVLPSWTLRRAGEASRGTVLCAPEECDGG